MGRVAGSFGHYPDLARRILRGSIGRRRNSSAIPFRHQRKPADDIRHVHKKAGAAGSPNVCRQSGCARAALELMPWSRAFDEPIQPPKGKALVTLRDAASYIMALPGKTRQSG